MPQGSFLGWSLDQCVPSEGTAWNLPCLRGSPEPFFSVLLPALLPSPGIYWPLWLPSPALSSVERCTGSLCVPGGARHPGEEDRRDRFSDGSKPGRGRLGAAGCGAWRMGQSDSTPLATAMASLPVHVQPSQHSRTLGEQAVVGHGPPACRGRGQLQPRRGSTAPQVP